MKHKHWSQCDHCLARTNSFQTLTILPLEHLRYLVTILASVAFGSEIDQTTKNTRRCICLCGKHSTSGKDFQICKNWTLIALVLSKVFPRTRTNLRLDPQWKNFYIYNPMISNTAYKKTKTWSQTSSIQLPCHPKQAGWGQWEHHLQPLQAHLHRIQV